MTDRSDNLAVLAADFLETFSFDEEFSTYDFDRWAWSRQAGPWRIKRLQGDYNSDNPGWGSLLAQRHQLKIKINTGAKRLSNDEQFQICVERQNYWRVYKLVKAASLGSDSLSSRVKRAAQTKFKNINSLLKAPVYDELSSETRRLLKNFNDQQCDSLSMLEFVCKLLETQAKKAMNTAKREIVSRRLNRTQLEFLFTDDEDEELQNQQQQRRITRY